MGATETTYAPLLKTHYYETKNTIPDLTLGEDPLLAMLTKKEDAGKTNVFPVIYGHNQGVSASFSDAQSGAGNLQAEDWNVTLADLFAVATIDGKLIAQTRNDVNAYLKAVTAEIDSAFKAAARRWSLHAYREGYGELGRLTEAAFTGTTITLGTSAGARKDWARNFEIGMRIVFSESQAGHTLRDTGDYLTVTGVDEDAGTVTVDDTLDNISGIAQYDFIFAKGERQNSATPSRLVTTGLGGWIPSSAPGSTSFFGVDRSVHPTRLGGIRVDGTQKQVKESLREAAVKVARAGGKPSKCFIGYDRWNQLEGELRGQIEYHDIEIGDAANVGFRAIRINGPKGPVDVVASNACPEDRGFMLDMDSNGGPILLSAGKAMGFLDEDDLKMLRQTSSNGYEVRVGGYPQLVIPAPGFSANIQFTA